MLGRILVLVFIGIPIVAGMATVFWLTTGFIWLTLAEWISEKWTKFLKSLPE